MPTIISHALVPLAIGLGLGRTRVAGPVLIAGMLVAMLPDADVIGFKLGIAYADPIGHRGASHSLVAAASVASLMTALIGRAKPIFNYVFLMLAMASHGVLDAFTNGGLGAALFWPISNARIFAPITPIQVSPIGAGFFSERGVAVLHSELLYIVLPLVILCILTRLVTHPRRTPANRRSTDRII